MLGLHDRDRIAELLLETARTLLRGVIPSAVEGAVLTAGDGPQFIVRAATPAYADFLARPLPYAPQATINQMVQHQGMLAIDDRLLIPLCWFGGINGVLMLQASGLSAELPESLRILVNQASAALESSLLFELAAIDTTTRAFTRAFAIQRLHEALKSAYRSGLDLTVLMLDLDKFKLVNDTYGHLVGDRVLHAAGQLLHAALRESDVLGRYGGDEFLIILPNTPIGGGVEVTRRLLQSVQEFRLDLDGASLALSISIGIGGISQDDQISTTVIRPSHEFFHRAMERLIAQADGLMYRAKHGSTTHYAAGLPMSWNGLLAGEGLLAV
jgi:diguanylate cyclase (GGDEF)-like protein